MRKSAALLLMGVTTALAGERDTEHTGSFMSDKSDSPQELLGQFGGGEALRNMYLNEMQSNRQASFVIGSTEFQFDIFEAGIRAMGGVSPHGYGAVEVPDAQHTTIGIGPKWVTPHTESQLYINGIPNFKEHFGDVSQGNHMEEREVNYDGTQKFENAWVCLCIRPTISPDQLASIEENEDSESASDVHLRFEVYGCLVNKVGQVYPSSSGYYVYFESSEAIGTFEDEKGEYKKFLIWEYFDDHHTDEGEESALQAQSSVALDSEGAPLIARLSLRVLKQYERETGDSRRLDQYFYHQRLMRLTMRPARVRLWLSQVITLDMFRLPTDINHTTASNSPFSILYSDGDEAYLIGDNPSATSVPRFNTEAVLSEDMFPPGSDLYLHVGANEGNSRQCRLKISQTRQSGDVRYNSIELNSVGTNQTWKLYYDATQINPVAQSNTVDAAFGCPLHFQLTQQDTGFSAPVSGQSLGADRESKIEDIVELSKNIDKNFYELLTRKQQSKQDLREFISSNLKDQYDQTKKLMSMLLIGVKQVAPSLEKDKKVMELAQSFNHYLQEELEVEMKMSGVRV
eukprot:GHVN01058034.1.p1 GENE.GHVN01058034.1~~GHVN01058034.1.p1  ORF type:complete len:571 (+),score=70.68 GHVN01058034.1:295-2007(+)